MISTPRILRFLCREGLLAGLLIVSSANAATDAEAQKLIDDYNIAQTQWVSEMNLAAGTRNVDIVRKKQPDPAVTAAKLKTLLRSDLANEWTLKYGAWLLQNDTALKPESQRALLNTVEKNHMMSPELGAFCMGLVNLNQGNEMPKPGKMPVRSRGMKLLETVKNKNPEPKVQGQAALALSIMQASLGDDGRLMRRRITNLKEAIIKSADVKLGNVTVAEIARDELYKISNLTKGRVAPNIQGFDSANRPISLKEFRGKVVMLVFWSSWDHDAGRVLEILRKSVKKKAAEPFAVVGVNRDSLLNLRTLEADQIVTWRNFSDPKQELAKAYRVASWPYCLVLDKEGAIAYRGLPGSFADAVANDLLHPAPQKLQK